MDVDDIYMCEYRSVTDKNINSYRIKNINFRYDSPRIIHIDLSVNRMTFILRDDTWDYKLTYGKNMSIMLVIKKSSECAHISFESHNTSFEKEELSKIMSDEEIIYITITRSPAGWDISR